MIFNCGLSLDTSSQSRIIWYVYVVYYSRILGISLVRISFHTGIVKNKFNYQQTVNSQEARNPCFDGLL